MKKSRYSFFILTNIDVKKKSTISTDYRWIIDPDLMIRIRSYGETESVFAIDMTIYSSWTLQIPAKQKLEQKKHFHFIYNSMVLKKKDPRNLLSKK